MSAVRLEGVAKRYGDLYAVQPMDLGVAQGEFLAIVGPSGCGKTTTMRMIAGLETPSAGRIVAGDTVLFDQARGIDVAPARRGVGMVFQSYALWPHMTVRANVAFGLEVKRLPRVEVEDRIASELRRLRIEAYGDRYPSELSGGQQQRVALARELATGARLLLMDEPLSNLDARLRTTMRAELKRLHETTGVTIVYVTHDQLEALTLATRLVVMNEGRVQQVGTPIDVYDRPANRFVAEFTSLTPLNLLEGVVEGTRFRAGSLRLDLDGQPRPPDGTAATLAARPESLRIARAGAPGTLLSGKVALSYVTGPATTTQVALDEAATQLVTVQEPRRPSPAIGEPVGVEVAADGLLWFDATHGGTLAVDAPLAVATA